MGNDLQIIENQASTKNQITVTAPLPGKTTISQPKITFKSLSHEKKQKEKQLQEDDSNCQGLDDEGPSAKYSLQFLKTRITASSNLMKLTNINSKYLLSQYRKLELKIQRESEFKKITTKEEESVQNNEENGQKGENNVIEEINNNKEKLLSTNKYRSIKIMGQNFNEIRNQSYQPYYFLEEKIGEGAFGNVYKGNCKETGELRAIKIFKQKVMNEEEKQKFLREIECLRKFDHVNIIKLYDLFFHKQHYYVVTEFCKGGSLLNIMRKSKLSSEFQVAIIMRQIFSALTYLHEQKITHRDLKLQNIVLLQSVQKKKKQIKMIDFGFATFTPNFIGNKGRIEGTLSYMPPQTFRGQFSTVSDIWSCGIILCVLLTGKNPFKGRNNHETIQNIKNKKIDLESKQK